MPTSSLSGAPVQVPVSVPMLPPPVTCVGVVGLGEAGIQLVRLLARQGIRTVALAEDEATAATAAHALSDADLVIEAAPDTTAAKRRALALIDRYARRDALVVTTAVEVPLESFVDRSAHPSRVACVRLCHPRLGKVAELVRRPGADPDVANRVAALFKAIGLHVLTVRDTGGVVVSDLILAMLDRAATAVERGEATAEDLDAAMRHGCG
ncbi:MAG: 3-hydroxybutyryl-CoA dehydrogenase, partial [Dactylosporangium sp.]|nr:3-hydroxybutyryl-CoA dehydrogenase [Dactylosporangium sp.]